MNDPMMTYFTPNFRRKTTNKEKTMSPQSDSFSDHVEMMQWIYKRNSYVTPEEMACMSAAFSPFGFDEEESEADFDWED